MTLQTGELWAWEAGEVDEPSFCPDCKEWVVAKWERDEDDIYCEWCPECGGGNLRDSEEPNEMTI